MRRLETHAYARAGLVGNPSDGYFGKTLSVSIRDFAARIVMYDWPTLEILPCAQDHVRFGNLTELALDVRQNGYYGGLRLVKGSLKRFHDYCVENDIDLPDRNFTIRYETNIPRQVGLAGSSAIITATFRALMQWFEIEIPLHILPNWILSVERDELGIGAGLQDRVCQAYEGLVYMDFNREQMERCGHGSYTRLNTALLPPLYLAYKEQLAEGSEVVHNNLRERWNRGEEKVLAAMFEFARITEQAQICLMEGRREEFAKLIDANFELRRGIIGISSTHLEMVETARRCGASAHFAGSGGAIIGSYASNDAFERLRLELGRIGCRVIRPQLDSDNQPGT